jgi:hypothetical protein
MPPVVLRALRALAKHAPTVDEPITDGGGPVVLHCLPYGRLHWIAGEFSLASRGAGRHNGDARAQAQTVSDVGISVQRRVGAFVACALRVRATTGRAASIAAPSSIVHRNARGHETARSQRRR